MALLSEPLGGVVADLVARRAAFPKRVAAFG